VCGHLLIVGKAEPFVNPAEIIIMKILNNVSFSEHRKVVELLDFRGMVRIMLNILNMSLANKSLTNFKLIKILQKNS
jgi:hypothetical protein